ncbi:MAG: hypothetical protein U5Q03_02625 [Bacteroidota bacterium]|nr:hypothetical protein [Bacteroidota bacterium]
MGNGETAEWNIPTMQAYETIWLTTTTSYDEPGDYPLIATITHNSQQEIFEETITIHPIYLVTGQVTDIFSDEEIESAMLTFNDTTDGIKTVTTDANGNYEVKIMTEDYIPVVIEKSDYTTFHTWLDNTQEQKDSTKKLSVKHPLKNGMYRGAVEKNYTLVPSDFEWSPL